MVSRCRTRGESEESIARRQANMQAMGPTLVFETQKGLMSSIFFKKKGNTEITNMTPETSKVSILAGQ